MIYDWKMELYWRMPVRLQEAALSIYARQLEKIYYGPVYKKWKDLLKGWRNWSPSFIEEWKHEQLRYIVEIAANHVPYYRHRFGDVQWRDVCSENDLQLLPLLEKQSLRGNEDSFIADTVDPKSLRVEKTSGTTGTSLRIHMSSSMLQQYWAITEVFVRNVAGVSHEMPRVAMGSRPIKRGDDINPPHWRYNRRWRQLYFSSYHISRETASDYIKAMRRYECQWMVGFGSAIAALADNALDAGLEPYPLKAVIVSGDTLLPNMRRSIEKFFQCKCYNQYGQTENTVMAMECEYERMHIIPMSGIIEILREDGSPCSAGEVGEVVGTSLLNDSMPLIRYRIGDYAAWAEERHCLCGNPNPIITKLEGRVDDYLITEDGRKIGRLAAFRRSQTIHSAQLVQDSPGHAYLLVRPGEGYRPLHAAVVCEDILERVGRFKLDVVEVPEIPKTRQGKTVTVIRLNDRPEMKEVYEKVIRKPL
ncbi:MAG: phenylacetate--CoA ligase family protein [Nitrospirae bacterium]|nr:phenylacetate--CoA ligase family protein [Nitrospirota bacterium]